MVKPLKQRLIDVSSFRLLKSLYSRSVLFIIVIIIIIIMLRKN